ncbi:predicted protein [Sparassis crispa]|uniref:Methyltransferase domain-containing protein n=1 Tax=Sparassis crispa TaxID=139825 RepID=A0A401GQ41_9APHY|nr:predicted protein [Sparassis crispa]GBE84355.1 predicted protein [Sparassis crispa]
MFQITREAQVPRELVPALDSSLLVLSETQLTFLHALVSPDDQELRRKILAVQKGAYERYPYPCIRSFHHVSLMASANPVYSAVLNAGRSGNTIFLDIGCCMGTDVRKLAFDGYPAPQILGCDLRQEYIDDGYKLYQDAATCPIHFFTSDIFSVPVSFDARTPGSADISTVTELVQLQGTVMHIYTGALFHLFDETTQYAIALRVAALLKHEPGAIVFGRHSGLEHEGMIDDHLGRTRYGHSTTSWPLLWKKVFAEAEGAEFAETRVVTEVKREEHPYSLSRQRGQHMLIWSVRIL